MSNVQLSKVFNGEYLRVITNYSHTIQKVLNSYDVVIFMARKAICFYQSMVLNGIIVPSDCDVVSSRVLDYNIISKLKNRKIAIIDDVVVKGRSLERVISELDKYDISSDIYVAACEQKVAEKLSCSKLHNVSEKFIYLDSSEIYLFSGLITEYIELSMCPFNIDQPIYECTSKKNIEKTISLINEFSSLNITSGIQKKYKIQSKVLYFKYECFDDNQVNQIIQKSILKIRFLYKTNKIVAIPFVLLPEITIDELDILYKYFGTEETQKLVDFGNQKITNENKLKLINCFFSDLLFKDFWGSDVFERCYPIDCYQFYSNTEKLYGKSLAEKKQKRNLSLVNCNFNQFSFPEQVGNAIQYIFNAKSNVRQYYNSIDKIIDDTVITYDYLFQKFQQNNPLDYEIVSSIIDVLIDRGMIVPSIIHSEDKILRAYKLGEYSKLTRTQIESFAAMLFKYQTLINNNIGKIEFEKLCVLFFSQGIHRRIFEQQTEYEDDCYSVCYSLYGPRVSDSNKVYKVESDSALITDFIENDLVIKQKNSYIINPIHIGDQDKNTELKFYAETFALQYSRLRKLFDSVKEQEQANRKEGDNKTLWNQYVHTYSQYLTLRAIGNSRKNQFLSLCAELYQIILIDDSFLNFDSNRQKRYNKIISGVNSGLWKYFCYKNDAFNKTNGNICDKNIDVAAIIASANIPVREDRNPHLELMIDNVGNLLYRFAFFIQNAVAAMNKISYFIESSKFESEVSDEFVDNSKMIFSSCYYKMFSKERHDMEERIKELTSDEQMIHSFSQILKAFQQESQFLLDYCELFLSSETPSYEYFKKMIVLYSKSGNLPDKIANLNEVLFENISSNTKCKIFILPDRETGNVILNEILESTLHIDSICYMVFDMKSKEEGAIQICEHAKGTFLSKLIKKEIDRLKDVPTQATPQMIFIKNGEISSFDRQKYKFIQTKVESISDDYVRTTLDILESSMLQ